MEECPSVTGNNVEFLRLCIFFPDLSCRIILTLIDKTRPELEMHTLFIDTIMQGTCNLHGLPLNVYRIHGTQVFIFYITLEKLTITVARSNSLAFHFLIKY